MSKIYIATINGAVSFATCDIDRAFEYGKDDISENMDDVVRIDCLELEEADND